MPESAIARARALRRAAGSLRRTLASRRRSRLRVRVDGLELHFATDTALARRWFYPRYAGGEPHEPALSRLLLAHLGPEVTFFDVGAHVGYFTVLGAGVCNGPRGAIHAFEMDPELIPLIERSLARNRGAGRVELVCAAVADRSGRLAGYQPHQRDNPSTNRLAPGAAGRPGSAPGAARVAAWRTPTLSLDDYCAQRGALPDVVKMDIEGAEALALAGMQALLRELRPVLLLELHPEQLAAFGANADDVLDAIERHDYAVHVVSDHRAAAGGAPEPLCRASLPRERPSVLYCRPRGRRP